MEPFLILTSLISYLILLPTAALCFVPMKNHLRFSKVRTGVFSFLLLLFTALAFSLVNALVFHDYRPVSLPMILIIFTAYHLSLDVHITASSGIFLLVCTLFHFVSNFSVVFDAFLHPESDLAHFSIGAALFQAIVSALLGIMLFRPFYRLGSYLVDNMNQPGIWIACNSISCLILVFNHSMTIHYYSTLNTNNVARGYINSILLMFILYLLLCIVLYFIVNALTEKAESDSRNHILEMQEKHYTSLQRYLDADARARHDFRQTIYTLSELAREKDYEAMNAYLDRFMESLPEKEASEYCKDHAVNALLNHYALLSEKNRVPLELQIRLPKELFIDSIDLCSILGNILENAIKACSSLPEDKRSIRLVLSLEQGRELYIAAANSFDGNIRQNKDRYLPTHRGGKGIGLYSISATAEKYGGTARFSHTDGVFYSDVMLINQPLSSQPQGHEPS